MMQTNHGRTARVLLALLMCALAVLPASSCTPGGSVSDPTSTDRALPGSGPRATAVDLGSNI